MADTIPSDRHNRRQSETESEPDEDQIKDWVQQQRQAMGMEGNDSSEQEEDLLDQASAQ